MTLDRFDRNRYDSAHDKSVLRKVEIFTDLCYAVLVIRRFPSASGFVRTVPAVSVSLYLARRGTCEGRNEGTDDYFPSESTLFAFFVKKEIPRAVKRVRGKHFWSAGLPRLSRRFRL